MGVFLNVCQRMALVFIASVASTSLLFAQSLDNLLPKAIESESVATHENTEQVPRFPVLDLEKVRFTGNKIHSDATIRFGLQTAMEIIGGLHSRATKESQIRTVVTAIQQGYDSSGVPLDIEVGEMEEDGQSFAVEFKFNEGPQYVWGGVHVNCSNELLREKIVRQLTLKTTSKTDTLVPSMDGSCMVGRKSGSLMTEWSDPSGAIPNDKPLIEKGSPASHKRPSFQSDLVASMTLAVEAAGLSSMDFDVNYKADEERHEVFAEVNVLKIGEPLIVSKVEFEGLSRHSEKQLKDFLEVHENETLTEQTILTIQRKLFDCGRFQWHTVRSSSVPGAPAHSPNRILTVSLQESDRVPRIDRELDDQQKALLRLGNAVNHAFDLPGNELSIEYSGNLSVFEDDRWFTPVQKRKATSVRFIVAKNSCSLSLENAGSKDLLITLTDGTLEFEGKKTSQRYRFQSEYLKYALVGYVRGEVPTGSTQKKENEELKTTSLTVGAQASTNMPEIGSICQFKVSPFSMLSEANRVTVSRKSGCLLFQFEDVFQIAMREERDQLVGFQIESDTGAKIRGRLGAGMIAATKQEYRSKTGYRQKPEVVDLEDSPMKLIDLADLIGDVTNGIVAKPGLFKELLVEMSQLVSPIRALATELSRESSSGFVCSNYNDPRLARASISHQIATKLFTAKSPQARFFRKWIQSELIGDLDLGAEAMAMRELPELRKPSFALLAAVAGLDQNGAVPFNAFSGTAQLAAGMVSSPREFLMAEFSEYDQVGTAYTKNVSAMLLRLGESESLKYICETLEGDGPDGGQFGKLLAVLREDFLRTHLSRCVQPSYEHNAAPERTASKNDAIAR